MGDPGSRACNPEHRIRCGNGGPRVQSMQSRAQNPVWQWGTPGPEHAIQSTESGVAMGDPGSRACNPEHRIQCGNGGPRVQSMQSRAQNPVWQWGTPGPEHAIQSTESG